MLTNYTGGLYTYPFKPRLHYIDTDTLKQDICSLSPFDNLIHNYIIQPRGTGKAEKYKRIMNVMYMTKLTYFEPKISLYSRRLHNECK